MTPGGMPLPHEGKGRMAEAGSVRVFVSHHHSPEEDVFTARLVGDLTAAGADVWVDDQRIAANNFVRKISEGLEGRQWLVLVMTPQSVASPWVRNEVDTALNEYTAGRMLGVIPFIMTPTAEQDIPVLWRPLHRYDATRGYEPARDRLLRAIGLTLAPPAPLVKLPAEPVAIPIPATRQPKQPSTPAPPVARELAAPDGDSDGRRLEPLAPLAVPATKRPARRHAPVYMGLGGAALVMTLIVALVATHGLGLLAKGGGSSSRPPAAPTQTALAWLAGGPTSSYGPTAPGARCDTWPLASQWTAALENNHVTCSGGDTQVKGQATLAFTGADGFVMGARFNITVNDFTAATNTDCLDFIVGASTQESSLGPMLHDEFHERLCPTGVITGGLVSSLPQAQGHVTLAGQPVTLGIILTGETWTLLVNGSTLHTAQYGADAYSYPTAAPSALDEVEVMVASGAQVTLSAFTVSLPANG